MAPFASQAGCSVDFGALSAGAATTLAPLLVDLGSQRRLQGSVAQGSVA